MPDYASAPALRSFLEHQIHYHTELSQRSCDALRTLSKLNLRLAEQLLADAVDTSRDLVQCAHPFQYGTVAWRHMVPLGEHLRNYQQGLWSMLSGAQSGFAQTTREQFQQAGRSAAAMAGDFTWQQANDEHRARH